MLNTKKPQIRELFTLEHPLKAFACHDQYAFV
jgi:hypothetical protein